ncbi:MAG TPA: biopolymer transporter ExbD [Phycisphaerae bacterium]|nr:biopolymer transporter ExbD [Phycisphaerae bacterium]
MARESIFRSQGGAGEVTFNMTPMIDCTFQLIIFFVLTSQVASSELARMELHGPYESQARSKEEWNTPHSVLINVTSAEEDHPNDPTYRGRAGGYVAGGEKIPLGREGESKVAEFLKARMRDHLAKKRKREDFYVEIRADKRVQFIEVLPVMKVAMAAEIMKMNITAKVEPKKIK